MSGLNEKNGVSAQPICNRCLNYIDDARCLAFDIIIPDEILFGENDHSKPLKGQKNDIVFEPIGKGKK